LCVKFISSKVSFQLNHYKRHISPSLVRYYTNVFTALTAPMWRQHFGASYIFIIVFMLLSFFDFMEKAQMLVTVYCFRRHSLSIQCHLLLDYIYYHLKNLYKQFFDHCRTNRAAIHRYK